MTIEKVEIRKLKSYEGVNAGRFVAEIEYKGERGSIQMPLTPEVSEKLLAFVALIAKLASDAANEIASDIFKAVEDQRHPAIEA